MRSLALTLLALAASMGSSLAADPIPRVQALQYEIDEVPYFASETIIGVDGPIVLLQCRRATRLDKQDDRKSGFVCRAFASPVSPFRGSAHGK